MRLFGNRDEYNGKFRIHIVNNKDRIQLALQICSLLISLVTIACTQATYDFEPGVYLVKYSGKVAKVQVLR